MIQAHVKGFINLRRYRRERVQRKENAALKIQAQFRSHRQRAVFKRQRRALMKCQANVLTRQFQRAYQKMRRDVVTCECYIKRYLAMAWYKKVRDHKQMLEDEANRISQMISMYNVNAKDFQDKMPTKQVANPHKHLLTYEDYELARARPKEALPEEQEAPPEEQTNVPRLQKMNEEYKRLAEENRKLQEQLHRSTHQKNPKPNVEGKTQMLTS